MLTDDPMHTLSEKLRLLSFTSLRYRKTESPLLYRDDITVEPNLKSQMNLLINYFSQFRPKFFITEEKGTCLAISQDSSSIFYGTSEGRLIGFRFHMKEKLLDVRLKKTSITCMCFSKATNDLLLGTDSGEVFIHSQSDKTQKQQMFAHKSGVTGICSSSSEFFTTGNDGKVISWKTGFYDDPQVIYSHQREVLTIDLSADERYLATGGNDGLVKIFEVSSMSLIEEIGKDRIGTITCVKFTAKNTFLAYGSNTGKIIVFDIKSLKKIHYFSKHSRSVTCLAATENEHSLISGGKDGKIFIWSLGNDKRNPIELEGHEGSVNSIQIFTNSQMFCSISKDLTLRTWGIPNFNHYAIFELDLKLRNFSEVFVGVNGKNYYYLKNENEILRVSRTENSSKSFNFVERFSVKAVAIDNYSELFCVAHSDENQSHKKKIFKFSFYTLESFKFIKIDSRKCCGVHSMIFSFDGSLLVIGEANKCTVLNSVTFEVYRMFALNRNPIEYLAISKHSRYLVSAGLASKNIKLYDVPGNRTLNIYEDETFYNIKRIIFSNDGEFFVVLPKEDILTVWTTLKKIQIFSLSSKDIVDVQFHQQYEYLYLIRENSIESLDFPSFTRSFLINFNENIKSFTFTQDWSELIIVLQTKIEIWKSPLSINSLTVYGDNSKLYSYCEYLGKAMAGKVEHHSEGFDSWIIEPFHMNTSHIFAYLNKTEQLSLSIAQGSGFVNSKTNFSPMDICLEMNNEKGIQAFFKFLKTESRSHPCLTNLLKSSVNKLLEHESSTTKEILDLILLKALDTGYPAYTSEVLPIINFYPTFLNISMPVAASYSKNIGKKVEYLQSYFKLNLKMGSNDSLNFLRSLFSTRNEETYNSRFVQTILEYKWNRSRKILICQAILYMIYLVLISMFAILDDKSLLTTAFVFNIILIFYEVVQICVSLVDYIKDGWNLIDIVRSVMMTLVFIRSQSPGRQNNITAFVIFISWVRGIAYFRIISYTRYYIRLIYHVIIDIIPFITLFLYSTIAFSIILFQISETQHSFIYVLAKCWEMNLTSFEGDEYSGYVYLSFAFYMMFNPIIMLTLLVSIMSHTFDRLNDSVRVAEGYALCKMIIEAELLFFWKRNLKNKTYLHVCRSVVSEFESDNLIEHIDDRVKNVEKEVISSNEDLNQKIEYLSLQIKEIKKTMHRILRNQETKEFNSQDEFH